MEGVNNSHVSKFIDINAHATHAAPCCTAILQSPRLPFGRSYEVIKMGSRLGEFAPGDYIGKAQPPDRSCQPPCRTGFELTGRACEKSCGCGTGSTVCMHGLAVCALLPSSPAGFEVG